MKKSLRMTLMVVLAGIFILPFITPIKVSAEGVVEEINVSSNTDYVAAGELPEYTVYVTAPNVEINTVTVEAYGSNTNWSKWETGMSSWHGFGTDTPTAVEGDTHYAMRLMLRLKEGYTFSDSTKINFNGRDVTNEGHTILDSGFDWGGYLYIDLGTTKSTHTITFVTNGGTPMASNKIVDGGYYYGEEIPTKEGYNFGGWYLDENLTIEYNIDFGDPKPITEDTTFYAKWIDKKESEITSVNVTIKAPKIGSKVTMEDINDSFGSYQMPSLTPTVVLEDGSHILFSEAYYCTSYPSINPDGYDEPFIGTFEEGKDYYIEVYLTTETGYTFADKVTLKVNGGTEYELSPWNGSRQLLFYTKIKADNEDSRVIKGANQTYSLNSTEKLSFEFDIDYDRFLENGKVYVDDKLVDAKNYTLSKGSTIVTFTNNYVASLTAGNHAIRVVSNNIGISTNFTITSNPKTGDNIIVYIIAGIASIIGMTTICIKKKI